MPLLEKMSARLPVVTGFTNAARLTAKDSALLGDVKRVAGFIYNDKFWNAQIGQIDITPERKFELIPVIGDHIIRIGDAEDIDEKLRRLYVFYQQILSKVGFSKYAALDVQYAGQVVAVKKGPVSAIDSIQLAKNIDELVNKASLETIDDEMLPQNQILVPKEDSAVSKTKTPANSVSTKTNPNPVLTQTHSNPPKTESNPNPLEKKKEEQKRPKAVMKRN
jgi:cell division protein FtsQ